MNDLVIAENVSKKLGAVQILKNVSFTIKSRELLAVQGHSGSGKSTLLGLLAGLEEADSGKIQINGTVITQLSEKDLSLFRRNDIGIVFQFFNLIPVLNVVENIGLPLYPVKIKHNEIFKRAKDAADKVGLSHRLHHYPNSLSGGEQQRVAIARALINNPKVIFADEPTGNLDSDNGKKIIELLKILNRDNGLTIAMVTHDNAIASEADRIIKLKDGEIQSE